MKASIFIEKLKDIVENYKTLYVMGCFGAPMSETNKKRYCSNHSYNRNNVRTKLIKAATSDTFGFDCVCLIKAVLWGWNGNKDHSYGGATYNSNNVPDINADAMIKACSDISTDFNNIEIGEALWTNGHIGVYIGNGLAIECTPAWDNKVQITACNCIKSGYNTRTWKKHGKLPYIEYDAVNGELNNKEENNTAVKIDYAQKHDASLVGSYKITALNGLHIRAGAGTDKTSLDVLELGTVVKNYGYYSVFNGIKWLYVKTNTGVVGFCSSKYLEKC